MVSFLHELLRCVKSKTQFLSIDFSSIWFLCVKRSKSIWFYFSSYQEPFKCEICDKTFERKYELRKHITIVHDGNLLNVRFVIKYLKGNTNWIDWESILQLFMMELYYKNDQKGKIDRFFFPLLYTVFRIYRRANKFL